MQLTIKVVCRSSYPRFKASTAAMIFRSSPTRWVCANVQDMQQCMHAIRKDVLVMRFKCASGKLKIAVYAAC